MPLPSLIEIQDSTQIIYSSMSPTPQKTWPLLSRYIGAEVWVKHENHTPIGAFKLRGGLTYIENLKKHNPNANHIITATKGNHGQSIAYATALFRVRATIVVPYKNNLNKNSAILSHGAKLIQHGKDFQSAFEWALNLAKLKNMHFIPSFDMNLVKGVSTYALEFFTKSPPLDAIYVPIGLGSGICGVIAARNALRIKTKIIGVVAKNAEAYSISFKNKKVTPTISADTVADGIACRTPNSEALEYILNDVERVITVSEEQILEAIGVYFSHTRNLAEGAAAAALAALLSERSSMQNKRVGIVLSGGNIDQDVHNRAIKFYQSTL